jgi:hypothetical protein
MNRKRTLSIAVVLLVLVLLAAFMAQGVLATATYVYHDKSTNTITGAVSGTYPQPYFSTSGGHGTTPWSTDTVTVRFKVEYQSLTNEVYLYYTTDGTDPFGANGASGGSIPAVPCTYEGTFLDNNGTKTVDVAKCDIPAQVAGTTVKYIVSALDTNTWTEVFANNGSAAGAATVFSYLVLESTAITLRSIQASRLTAVLPVVGGSVVVLPLALATACAAAVAGLTAWRGRSRRRGN